MKNTKSESPCKHHFQQLKDRLKTVHWNRILVSQSKLCPESKSSQKIPKFIYFIEKDVLNNFCEGKFSKIILEKLVENKPSVNITEIPIMGSFTRSENQAIVPLISTPKIPKLKYVKLQDIWRNFQEESVQKFGSEKFPQK